MVECSYTVVAVCRMQLSRGRSTTSACCLNITSHVGQERPSEDLSDREVRLKRFADQSKLIPQVQMMAGCGCLLPSTVNFCWLVVLLLLELLLELLLLLLLLLLLSSSSSSSSSMGLRSIRQILGSQSSCVPRKYQ